VTGFGLAGHLLEMLDGSGVAARLDASQVRLYEGFSEVTERGILSTLHGDNARAACRVQGALPPPAWLFDPQTSGGLLAGVTPASAGDVLRALIEAGCEDATIIGEVLPLTEGEGPRIEVSGSAQARS
jgi:selenide,water dikinase